MVSGSLSSQACGRDTGLPPVVQGEVLRPHPQDQEIETSTVLRGLQPYGSQLNLRSGSP